jgi:uncharacterized C2H2 Zn-finger protein
MSKETSSKNEPYIKEHKSEVTQQSQSENKTQNQYKCQRCNQLLANQNDLNEHNKKVHNIEPDKMGKEPEAKKSTPT